MNAYNESIFNVSFAGPTLFGLVINAAATISLYSIFQILLVCYGSLKELLASKSKDKKRKGKSRRLRKKMISDSKSEETSPIILYDSSNGDSDGAILSAHNTLPSRVTRSKERDLTLENDDEPNVECEKTIKATNSVKTEENVDAETIDSVEKSNNLDDDDVPEILEKEKTPTDKVIEVSSEVLPSQNGGDATSSKKKRKRDKRGETTNMKLESPKRKKQAINIDKNSEEQADNKQPQEPETSSSEVIIKEVQKGKLEGKQSISGKKVSILYPRKLKDTERVFASNLGEAPLRFRLGGGDKVIKGLIIGVEGMRVGDKRKLIIPPSLGSDV